LDKFSLPSNRYVVPHQHKYSIGDNVRNINNADWNKYHGAQGIVVKLLPFGTMYPAYDVRYGDDIIATSERSIERVN
jgi:hypothetical protein